MGRYDQFSHSNAPLATFPAVEAPPVPSRAIEKRIELEVDVEHRTQARRVQYFGFDATVTMFDYAINPFVLPGPDVVTLMSFRVPEGRVLEVRQLGVAYNEPLYHMADQIGWRPTVDDGQVPYIGNMSGKVLGYFTSPLGDFHNLAEVEPIYVQTNSVFAIKLYRGDPFFVGFLIASAWIVGKLHKPIGGRA